MVTADARGDRSRDEAVANYDLGNNGGEFPVHNSETLQEQDSSLEQTRSGRVRRRPRHLLGNVVDWDR